MVGGTVIETIQAGDRIWINCRDQHGTTCAIYVRESPAAQCVQPGDTVW